MPTSATFSFTGLDIDRIETLSPPTVDAATIDDGTSPRSAFVSIGFANGSWCRASLAQTGWTVSPSLNCATGVQVPEPATWAPPALGPGLTAGSAIRRRR